MRLPVRVKYLGFPLIVISALTLVVNYSFLRDTDHPSRVQHEGGRDTPLSNFLHAYGRNKQLKVQETVNDKQIPVDAPFHFKTVPLFNVMDRYTKYSDLIPRRAYHTHQLIDGTVQNAIVILAEVKAEILERNLIDACRLGDQYSTSVRIVRDPIMWWVQMHKKGYTHFFAIIYCFGLHLTDSGHSTAISVVYRTGGNATYRVVRTENSLHVLTEDSPKKNSLVICATMYGHPTRFDEWLRYQKTIGVDMVHINVQVSFVVDMEQYPFLMESQSNGFVKLEVWKEYLGHTEIFYHSQSLIYQDCLLKYKHSFEYAMMIDYDEFFIPTLSGKNDIHHYLKLFFSSEKTASVAVPWIQYHCEPLNYTTLVDGNITSTLSGQSSEKRREAKSIHRLEFVEIVSIHKAYKTLAGYSMYGLHGVHQGYIAHIRPNKRKCKNVR